MSLVAYHSGYNNALSVHHELTLEAQPFGIVSSLYTRKPRLTRSRVHLTCSALLPFAKGLEQPLLCPDGDLSSRQVFMPDGTRNVRDDQGPFVPA